MKVAIPVESETTNPRVCISFGRAPYYLIYNTENDSQEFVSNSAATSQGGAGIRAAQALLDEGIEAVITPRCGENAATVLNGGGVKMYRTVNDNVSENIKLLKEGKLSLLSEIHPGFHTRGI